MFIDYHFEHKSLKDLIKNYRYTIINFIIGAIIYKVIIFTLTKLGSINPNYYNLQTITPSQYLSKFKLISQDLIKQFFITLPFFTLRYKITTFLITLLAIVSIFQPKQKPNPQKFSHIISFTLFIAIFYSALITLFLSTSIDQTEFSPRIDFFGLMYVYSIMLALTLKSKSLITKNLATLLAIFSILQSTNTLFEAQKVWKLGYDAELKTFKRIIKTYEQSPNFIPEKRYIIVQGGSHSLRDRFYHTPYKINSEDLLDISYVPAMNSSVTINYHKPFEYADPTAYVYTFTPNQTAKDFIQQASPWPNKNSISIGEYWIMLVLNQQGLNYLKSKYLP
jgi:hypothetical protein